MKSESAERNRFSFLYLEIECYKRIEEKSKKRLLMAFLKSDDFHKFLPKIHMNPKIEICLSD